MAIRSLDYLLEWQLLLTNVRLPTNLESSNLFKRGPWSTFGYNHGSEARLATRQVPSQHE